MHRLLVIVAMLFGLSAVASPTIAASVVPVVVHMAASAADDICLMSDVAFPKAATFKPCAKGANGKAMLPCHLPPMINTVGVTLVFNDRIERFDIVDQGVPPIEVLAGHFRPPRVAAV